MYVRMLCVERVHHGTCMYACYVWNGYTTALAYTHTHTGRAAYAGMYVHIDSDLG